MSRAAGSPSATRRIPPGKKLSFAIVSDVKASSKALTKATTAVNHQLRGVWNKISTLEDGTKAAVIADILAALGDFTNSLEQNRQEILKSVRLAKSAAEHVTTEEDDREVTTSTVEMDHAVPNYDLKTALSGGSDAARLSPMGSKSPVGVRKIATKGHRRSQSAGFSPTLSPKSKLVTSQSDFTSARGPDDARGSSLRPVSVSVSSAEPEVAPPAVTAEVSVDLALAAASSASPPAAVAVADSRQIEAEAAPTKRESIPHTFKAAAVVVVDEMQARRASMTKVQPASMGFADAAQEAMRKKKAKKAAAEREKAFDAIGAAAREADAEAQRMEAAARAAALKANPWSAVTGVSTPQSARKVDGGDGK